jgi:hypothetical protein
MPGGFMTSESKFDATVLGQEFHNNGRVSKTENDVRASKQAGPLL